MFTERLFKIFLLEKYFYIVHQHSILLCFRCNGASIWIGQKVKFKERKKEMIEILGHNFSQTAPVTFFEIRNWSEETGSTMWSSIGKLPNWRMCKKSQLWPKDAKAYQFRFEEWALKIRYWTHGGSLWLCSSLNAL